MFLSDLSIRRPVLMTMVLAALLLFGVIAFTNLPLNLMPDAQIPFVTVRTVYPGAGPEQIARQITQRIEDEISTISQIRSIQSFSLDSASIIILEFELAKNPDVATQEVKDKVDQIINDLPAAAQTPVVEKIDITAFPIVNMVMSGDLDALELSRLAETVVRDELSRIAGVGTVSISGARKREIRVEFENRVVYENAISLSQVAGILAAANLDMPGGNIQARDMDFSVRLEGLFSAVDELADLDIPTGAGSRRLGSIASIRDTGAEVRERTVFFDNVTGDRDENTILIGIIKSPDGNTVDIADDVIAAIPGIEAQMPPGVRFRVTSDNSVEIRDTVADTLMNIGLGIVLTAMVLLLFLHDLRSTLIVALAMPMSIIPTFFVMDFLGMSLNLMSLMGISTAVGVLVMNSVVVIENIFRHKMMGHDRKTAAAAGTSEVVVAVLASTLTNIAVFLPMANMRGIAGLFLQEFALAVSFATLFSMIISFTLTPMLASRLLPEQDRKKHPLGDRLEAGFHSLERGYAFILRKILHSRLRSGILILFGLGFFGLAIVGFGRIPFEFIPEQDSGRLRVEVELPQGTALAATAARLQQIEERIARYGEVSTIVTSLGSLGMTTSGTNVARVTVELVDVHLRDRNNVVAARLAEDLADIPGARIRVGTAGGMMGGGAAITFYLQGPDMTLLTDFALELRPRLQEIPGLINVDISTKPGRPEVVLRPDRLKLNDAGITVQDLATTMRAAVEGLITTTYRDAGEEYDIRVTLGSGELQGSDDIESIIVATRAGLFPLGHFAEVSVEQGINQILRREKVQAVEVTAGVGPGYVTGEMTAPIEAAVAALDMPAGYSLNWGGDTELLNETVREFIFVFILAVALTYMLLAAILEKFGQPILILSTVPLSLIGVAAAFLLTGKTMNIVSMLAIVMLVGLVVNNAILILDYANQLRARGKTVRQALLEAAPTKLKPIMMANIATMLGMLPMALGIGASGAELRQPMGIVSIGGLFVATFLSLFVIPALENLIESRKAERTETI
ncbi:MAG: efflux RND transporter permease subunit [Spirochaetaceae bacterium]|nr:MAG: efflux RND transporter permease subunit [Spirochaetaceae bacterium]